jgi:hypothetical protein
MENLIHNDSNFIHKEESLAIRGAIFEVYKTIGVVFWSQFTRNVLKENLRTG